MEKIEIIDIYKTSYKELFNFLYENKIECSTSAEKIGGFYDVTIELKDLGGIEIDMGNIVLVSDMNDTVELLPQNYGYITMK